MAALHLGVPEWNHANLLQPAGPLSAAYTFSQPAEQLPIAALLPAFDAADVELGADAGRSHLGEAVYGALRGRDAIAKAVSIADHPAGALELAAEVRKLFKG